MGNYLRKPETDKELDDGENEILRYGVAAMQGWRLHMEDAHTIALDIDEHKSCAFGVFDGHGGGEVAKFCSMYYIGMLMDNEYYHKDIQRAIMDTFLRIDIKINSEKQRLQLVKLANSSESEIKQQAEELQDDGITLKPGFSNSSLKDNKQSMFGSAIKYLCPYPQANLQKTKIDKKFEDDQFQDDHEEFKDEDRGINELDAIPYQEFLKLAAGTNYNEQDKNNKTPQGDNHASSQGNQQHPNSGSSDSNHEGDKNATSNQRSSSQGASQEEGEERESDKQQKQERLDQQFGAIKSEQAVAGRDKEGQKETEQEEERQQKNAYPPIWQQDSQYDDLNALEDSPRERDYIGPIAGSTGNFCFLRGNTLVCANIGDSRSVLSRNGHAVPLSKDHKPEDSKEEDRITKAGGFIVEGRINGSLNLSRALGDAEYKQNRNIRQQDQIISCEPDIKSFEIDETEDEFIIIGCDGIWDSYTNAEAVYWVRQRLIDGQDPKEIARDICDEILAPGVVNYDRGCDNMSIIIIVFNWALEKFQKLKMEQLYSQIQGSEGEGTPSQRPSGTGEHIQEEEVKSKKGPGLQMLT